MRVLWLALSVAILDVSTLQYAEQVPVPVLKSGNGFQLATESLPNDIDDGYKPIARWDLVPFQEITKAFDVGVIAFHTDGIRQVDFSLEGGPWISVTEMTRNTRTGVDEYRAIVDPSSLSDGRFEIRARVIPISGPPVILQGKQDEESGIHSAWLFANANGSISKPVVYVSGDGNDQTGDGSRKLPWRSLAKAMEELEKNVTTDNSVSGCTVYMLKGKYEYGGYRNSNNHDRWVTFAAAPGVPREDVIINRFSAYFWECWIHLQNLTLNTSLQGKGTAKLWMDQVDYYNPSGYTETWSDVRFNGGEWYTDCRIHNLHLGGASGFVRNTTFEKIGEDPIRGAHSLINVELKAIRSPPGSRWHSDLVQGWIPKNSIAYGVTVEDCLSEGMTGNGRGFDGRAMVNCSIDNVKAWIIGGKQNQRFRNVYVKNCKFTGKCLFRHDKRFRRYEVEHMVFENCTFSDTGENRPAGWERLKDRIVFREP